MKNILPSIFLFFVAFGANAQPQYVTIAGDFQDELGCSGDWQPDCAVSHLTFDAEDQVWQGIFNIPAGNWQYKAAIDDSWDENYGAGALRDGPNIGLTLAAPTSVKFYYDPSTHWVTDNVNSIIAVAVGSFQSEIGCGSDWDPACLAAWLQDPDGDNIYTKSVECMRPGNYEFKVALNEAFDVSYPASNIAFEVTETNRYVTFIFNANTNAVSVEVNEGSIPQPSSVTVAGNFQDEVGCPGDWQPDCAVTHLIFDAEDLVWQGTYNIPAGSYEYKAALDDSWDVNYGSNAIQNGPNIAFSLGAATDVKFYYENKDHWITDNINSIIAVAAGSFQSEIGCGGDWDPACLRSWLKDIDGDGIYTWSTECLPPGDYEAKIAINETWDVSYPASNYPFHVLDYNVLVTFIYNSNNNEVLIEVDNPLDISIADPCDCDDPLNIRELIPDIGLVITLFHDVLTVVAPPDQTVALDAGHENFQDENGDQIPDNTIIPETEIPGMYQLEFFRPSGASFQITVSADGVNQTLFVPEETCFGEDCPVIPIPTLSQWGILILTMLMLIVSIVKIREHKYNKLPSQINKI